MFEGNDDPCLAALHGHRSDLCRSAYLHGLDSFNSIDGSSSLAAISLSCVAGTVESV